METMAGRQPRAVDASLRPLSIAFALLIWSVCCAAVSVRALPDGGSSNSNMTELQMHVSFFDRNKDGILIPLETFQGFVAIGCEIAFSTAAASTIHTALAPLTNPPGALPPYVNIYVEYIHKAIHGSDTGAYDSKGRFVQEKFDEIFTKHAHIRKDALSLLEVEEMLTFNRDVLDPASWAAAEAEWQLIYQLAHDRYGFLTKERARGIYNGNIFVELEERSRRPLHSNA
ncbi:probable peroxygenase 5 isoform X1 [Miscanthus floridulus]|uniref:probable peroxygenase 5 isoform X1 n=1 Tax=Miscanthus floridulus TaxID=154761 RepID=UPI003458C203